MAAPKPKYYCAYPGCSASYTTKASREEHLLVTHEGHKFRCDVEGCNYGGSPTRKGLSDHKKTAHPTATTMVRVCQWRGCRHKSLTKNMRRHEYTCRLKPLSWGNIPQRELPIGVLVNAFDFDANRVDITNQQFADPLPADANADINNLAVVIQPAPVQLVQDVVPPPEDVPPLEADSASDMEAPPAATPVDNNSTEASSAQVELNAIFNPVEPFWDNSTPMGNDKTLPSAAIQPYLDEVDAEYAWWM